MNVYFAADHGGFEMKNHLLEFIRGLGYEVEDCGAYTFDINDDYPVFIQAAARKVSIDIQNGIESRAIVIGGSGQGEAFAANKIKGIRAVVYYGEPKRMQTDADGKEIDMITSTRDHNDSNVLSLGGRFITEEEAKTAAQKWLAAKFSGAERHVRRHKMLEENL
jgi:ribose 5-phosphate isomerase B